MEREPENVREKAEQARAQGERQRQVAADQQAGREQERVSAEADRENSEWARRSAERGRVREEALRNVAEEARKTAASALRLTTTLQSEVNALGVELREQKRILESLQQSAHVEKSER